jgi:hypothetical protein
MIIYKIILSYSLFIWGEFNTLEIVLYFKHISSFLRFMVSLRQALLLLVGGDKFKMAL